MTKILNYSSSGIGISLHPKHNSSKSPNKRLRHALRCLTPAIKVKFAPVENWQQQIFGRKYNQ